MDSLLVARKSCLLSSGERIYVPFQPFLSHCPHIFIHSGTGQGTDSCWGNSIHIFNSITDDKRTRADEILNLNMTIIVKGMEQPFD